MWSIKKILNISMPHITFLLDGPILEPFVLNVFI